MLEGLLHSSFLVLTTPQTDGSGRGSPPPWAVKPSVGRDASDHTINPSGQGQSPQCFTLARDPTAWWGSEQRLWGLVVVRSWGSFREFCWDDLAVPR